MLKRLLCVFALLAPFAIASAQTPAKATADAAPPGPKVLLHTNQGDITIELEPGQGAENRRQLPAVREGRFLRRHHLPPRDPEVHGAGRRLEQGHAAQTHARADP